MAANSEDWISIAEQASKEMNPAKLMTLVKQLCSALDDSKKMPASERPDPPPPASGKVVASYLEG